MATVSTKSTVIYLIRNDLRVHDNECLYWAQQNGDYIVPLFCFDKHMYGTSTSTWHFGFPKAAHHRTRFVLESVADMRDTLRKCGSDLVVRSHQSTVEALGGIIQLCHQNTQKGHSEITVVYQREIAKEEIDVEAELCQLCQRENVTIKTFWGLTLYHVEDLPFPSIQFLPDTYTGFRKNVETRCKVRPLVSMPENLKSLPLFVRNEHIGVIPTLGELISDLSLAVRDMRSAFPFPGGEMAGISRLDYYLWKTDHVAKYKETRNGLIGVDYSTKLSPWLAVGAVSPRKVFHSIKNYEAERSANHSTYWVIFELLWRDYFKFVNMKYGDRIFYLSGIMKKTGLPWKKEMATFDRWRHGQTGIPFVDANMRELLQTGWMSNRGRQNVASFLVKDLGIDWRLGAEWFESLLVDHDVSSNYGNWNYSAGIGNDPRENRKFNMIKQAHDYDPRGEFVRLWVPELASLKGATIHTPWMLSASELRLANVSLSGDYPRPIIVQPEWSRHAAKVKGAGQNHSRAQRGVDFYFKPSRGRGLSRKRN